MFCSERRMRRRYFRFVCPSRFGSSRESNTTAKMFMDLMFFATGFGGSAIWNYMSGVALHRGHPRNFACGLAFGVFGYYFRTKLEEMDRVRLFQLEEYVRTHPEDFPPIERKKWGEVFKEWKAPFRPGCD